MFPRHTPRLLLREITYEDIEAIWAITSNPENTQHMIWGPATRRMVRAFVRHSLKERTRMLRTYWAFVLIDRTSLELVGICYVMLLPHDLTLAKMGCIIRKQDWRKGFADEITAERIRFAFDDLSARMIEATCAPDNIASIRNLQGHGFTSQGTIPNAVWHKGKSRDSILFTLQNHKLALEPPVLVAV